MPFLAFLHYYQGWPVPDFIQLGCYMVCSKLDASLEKTELWLVTQRKNRMTHISKRAVWMKLKTYLIPICRNWKHCLYQKSSFSTPLPCLRDPWYYLDLNNDILPSSLPFLSFPSLPSHPLSPSLPLLHSFPLSLLSSLFSFNQRWGDIGRKVIERKKNIRTGFLEETQLCFHLRGVANWYRVSICDFTKCAHVTWGFDFLIKTLLVDSVGVVKTQLPPKRSGF